MASAIEVCDERFPNQQVRLAAQTYLLDFYQQYGFSEIGPEYLEDDLPHQDMIRRL